MRRWLGIIVLTTAGSLVLAGASGDSAERESEIREQAAKAAAEAGSKIEEAGRAVKAAVDGAKRAGKTATRKRLI